MPLVFRMVLESHIGRASPPFVAARLSDAPDGWPARRGGGDAVGAAMDPLAGKALQVTLCVTLAGAGMLSVWLAALAAFRDALIVGGVAGFPVTGHAVTLQPLYVAKVNTVLQTALVAVTLQGAPGSRAPVVPGVPAALVAPSGLGGLGLSLLLIWAVTVATLGSGTTYVWNAARGGLGATSGPG